MRPVETPSRRPMPRAQLGWSAAGSFLIFAALGLVVRGSSSPLAVDRAVARVVWTSFGSHSSSLSREMVPLGAPLVGLLVAGSLAVVAHRRGDRLAVALCLAGPIGAMAFSDLVAKPLVGRLNNGDLSYPSGHVTCAAALTTLALLMIFRWNGVRPLLRWSPLVVALPLAVSVAVVRLNLHYLTDAIGGLALGAAVVLAVAAALPEPQPVGPSPPVPLGHARGRDRDRC